ncbi:MAG: ribosomal protein L7/L12 [Pseudomonadales bacterium]|nr:ribosomal protein L7/L12 [Pseudomonadales bacterium]
MDTDKVVELPTSAVSALAHGSKIEAIKAVRETYGTGLKEAKEIVEAYLDNHPELGRKMHEANRRAGKSFLGLLIIVGLVSALVYYGLFAP